METEARIACIQHTAEETRAQRMVLYDLRGRSSITDFSFLCNGRSQTHVRGIGERIEMALKRQGVHNLGQEGFSVGSWIVMDYDTVVVHIFDPDMRTFYDLDELYTGYPQELFRSEEDPLVEHPKGLDAGLPPESGSLQTGVIPSGGSLSALERRMAFLQSMRSEAPAEGVDAASAELETLAKAQDVRKR